MSCTALWTALAQQHIAPVFPQWQVYAATAYADRGGDTLAQAVFHVLSPFCFYCGKVCLSAASTLALLHDSSHNLLCTPFLFPCFPLLNSIS